MGAAHGSQFANAAHLNGNAAEIALAVKREKSPAVCGAFGLSQDRRSSQRHATAFG